MMNDDPKLLDDWCNAMDCPIPFNDFVILMYQAMILPIWFVLLITIQVQVQVV